MFKDKKDHVLTQRGEVTPLDLLKVLSSVIGTLSIILTSSTY